MLRPVERFPTRIAPEPAAAAPSTRAEERLAGVLTAVCWLATGIALGYVGALMLQLSV